MDRADVIIFGGGLVGLALASALDSSLSAIVVDPADAAPDYWHHVHNRLSVNETPRAYTKSRHQAWLHRRKVAP